MRSNIRSKKQKLQALSLGIAVMILFALIGSSLQTYALSSVRAEAHQNPLVQSSSNQSTSTQSNSKNSDDNSTFVGAPAAAVKAVARVSAQISGGNDEAKVVSTENASVDTKRRQKEDAVLTRDEEEILWLARVLYSETKRASEQRLIAWVVRNRVETGFWDGHTYKAIATQPDQFSGLQPKHPHYDYNISLSYSDTDNSHWNQALSIARSIYYAPSSERPFSQMTRHFYSPHAVTRHPQWASGQEAIHTVEANDGRIRFAFYSYVR